MAMRASFANAKTSDSSFLCYAVRFDPSKAHPERSRRVRLRKGDFSNFLSFQEGLGEIALYLIRAQSAVI